MPPASIAPMDWGMTVAAILASMETNACKVRKDTGVTANVLK